MRFASQITCPGSLGAEAGRSALQRRIVALLIVRGAGPFGGVVGGKLGRSVTKEGSGSGCALPSTTLPPLVSSSLPVKEILQQSANGDSDELYRLTIHGFATF